VFLSSHSTVHSLRLRSAMHDRARVIDYLTKCAQAAHNCVLYFELNHLKLL
jgi:hypothetical protein